MSHIPNAAMPHADAHHAHDNDHGHDGHHHAEHKEQAHAKGAEKDAPSSSSTTKEQPATQGTDTAVKIGAWVALGAGLGAAGLALAKHFVERDEEEKPAPKRKRKSA